MSILWSQDWTWSLPLIVLTIVIHVVALSSVSGKIVGIVIHPDHSGRTPIRFFFIIGAIALLATLLLAIAAGLWAVTYLWLGALPDFRSAILYSLGAITAFGHADVYLAPRWQLMGALEALNGIMLFGLTTAYFFDVIQSIRARTQN